MKVKINKNGILSVPSASMIEKIEEKAEDQGAQSMETDAGKEGEPKSEVGRNATSRVLYAYKFFDALRSVFTL